MLAIEYYNDQPGTEMEIFQGFQHGMSADVSVFSSAGLAGLGFVPRPHCPTPDLCRGGVPIYNIV